jgi:hypothetical protein
MGLAPIRFPQNLLSGLIALPEPDGDKSHPYSRITGITHGIGIIADAIHRCSTSGYN